MALFVFDVNRRKELNNDLNVLNFLLIFPFTSKRRLV